MTPNEFVTNAVRTESKISEVVVNQVAFDDIITAMIALGNILDQIKKNVFYKKPYNQEKISELLYVAATHIDLLRKDVEDGRFPNPNLETAQNVNPRIFHSVVGIVTEGVELLEAIELNSEEVDKVNLLEEFGDLAWYQAIGIDETGGSFEQVLERVIAKLRARYPEKFTSEAAINRDLAKERKVLEGKSEQNP